GAPSGERAEDKSAGYVCTARLRGLNRSGSDTHEAASSLYYHTLGGFDHMTAVCYLLVVYFDSALLYQALGLLAVGGEAGIDEEVEDADLALLVGFVAEGAR